MQSLIIAWVLLHPIDGMTEQQWFGVTERTCWNIYGHGVRWSVWCSGERYLSFGISGKIFGMIRVW